MNLDIIAEVYEVLQYHIEQSDRKNAATDLVDFLINNNFDADEIKQAFTGEKAVLKALEAYTDSLEEYEDDSYEDEEDGYDNDW